MYKNVLVRFLALVLVVTMCMGFAQPIAAFAAGNDPIDNEELEQKSEDVNEGEEQNTPDSPEDPGTPDDVAEPDPTETPDSGVMPISQPTYLT